MPASIDQNVQGAGMNGMHAAHGVAVLILGSLAVVFLFHYLGFRFVVAVGGGGG